LSNNEDWDDDNDLILLLDKTREEVTFETISNAITIANSEENPGRRNQLRSFRIEQVRYELLTDAIGTHLTSEGDFEYNLEPAGVDFDDGISSISEEESYIRAVPTLTGE
jgi:hypothetical protein